MQPALMLLATTQPTPTPPLLDRDDELAALRDAVHGRGPGLAVVTAGPGCGRTTLLHAALADVPAGVRVLSATATHAERDQPLGLVTALLGAPVPDLSAALRDSASPVVVAVDDLHHADEPSIAALLPLRHLDHVRVVVTDGGTDFPHRAGLTAGPHRRVVPRPLPTGPDDPAGGNPTLLDALAQDGGAVGPVTRRALLDCLRRQDPAVFEVACGLAVLGEHGTPDALGALTARHPGQVADLLVLLDSAGLLRDGRLRLPGADGIVLGGLSPEEAAGWHERAARLLHDRGADALDVARRCIAADRPVGGVRLLRAAAAAARALGDHDAEIACLRLALRSRTPGGTPRRPTRTTGEHAPRPGPVSLADDLRVALGDAQWRVNPAAAARTLLPLAGRVHALPVLRTHWWQGGTAPADPTGLDHRAAVELALCRDFVLGRPEPVPSPEWVLQGRRADSPPEALVTALLALHRAGDRERFAHWSAVLAEEGRRDVTLLALLDCVRAHDAWSRGDVATTLAAARAGLDRLPLEGWGVVAGFPLAMLVRAATARDEHDAAAAALAIPVPDGLYASAFGPAYRQARGHHHLATGRPLAALDDFQAGEGRTADWYLDVAAARLLLDQPEAARVLLRGRSAPDARTRGVTARLLARAVPPAGRGALLAEAVRELEPAGDRRELAHALADLSRERRAHGLLAEARYLARRARQEARAGGFAVPAAVGSRPRTGDGPLTAAERGVAELAVAGHSNREIGRRLCITVSTVEQHLTRIYRKLDVTRRDELPGALAG